MRGLKAAGDCGDSALVKRTSGLLLDRSLRQLELTAQAVGRTLFSDSFRSLGGHQGPIRQPSTPRMGRGAGGCSLVTTGFPFLDEWLRVLGQASTREETIGA